MTDKTCDKCGGERKNIHCGISQWHDGEIVISAMETRCLCGCGETVDRVHEKVKITDYPARCRLELYEMDCHPEFDLKKKYEVGTHDYTRHDKIPFTTWTLRRLGIIGDGEPIDQLAALANKEWFGNR